MLEELAALGLTGEVTPQQVKRAYLRKVKEHPPERDPEGFQRVRRAYEEALAALAQRALAAEQTRAAESAPEPLPEAPEPPRAEPSPDSPAADASPPLILPRFPPHVAQQIELLNRALAEE